MADNKGSTAWLWWTLGVFAFLGLGAGTFIYLKKKGLIGNKNKEEGGEEKSNETTTPESLNTGTTSYTPTSNTSSTTSPPSTNLSQEEGNKFREWMSQYHPEWRDSTNDVLNKSGKPDNRTMREAWAKYSAEYKNQQGSSSNTATNNTLIGQYGTQIDNATGWKKIQGGILTTQGLKKESTYSSELIYYIIDVQGIADYVVHLYENGLIMYGKQTYGNDEKQNWGKWFYKIDKGKEKWAIEMNNGKGNGEVDFGYFAWMIKAVFNAQYPDVAEEYKSKGEYSGFSLTDGYDFDGDLRGLQGKYVDPMDSTM